MWTDVEKERGKTCHKILSSESSVLFFGNKGKNKAEDKAAREKQT